MIGQSGFMQAQKKAQASLATGGLDRLQKVMGRAGWEIEYVDLDLTGKTPKAEIKIFRMDGRFLWARVDSSGRCTIEAYHRERGLGMAANQRGRRPLTYLVEDVFLGRTKHEGARSMLRHMTNYLTDNAMQPILLSDVRAAWAGVMGGRVAIDSSKKI